MTDDGTAPDAAVAVLRRTDAVEHDEWDAAEWAALTVSVPIISDLATQLRSAGVDEPDGLLRDVTMLYLKSQPRVRETYEMRADKRGVREVVSALAQTPETNRLRQQTRADPYGAVMALVAVSETILSMLTDPEVAAETLKALNGQPEDEPESEPKPEAEPEPGAEPEPEVEPEPEDEDESGGNPEPEPEGEPEPESEPEGKSKPEGKGKSKPEDEGSAQDQEPCDANADDEDSDPKAEDENGEVPLKGEPSEAENEPASESEGQPGEGQPGEPASEGDDGEGDDGEGEDEPAGENQEPVPSADNRDRDGEKMAEAVQAAAEQYDPARVLARELVERATEPLQQTSETLSEESDLFAAFGADPGEVKEMDFEERRRVGQALTRGPLAKFARLFGRFRSFAAAAAAKRVEYTREEVVGSELGADPTALVAAELAMLGHPVLGRDLMIRISERRAMVRSYKGSDRSGRGPVIILVDGSGSMKNEDASGVTREAWSKAIVVAILAACKQGSRDVDVVHFASQHQLKAWRFPGARATPAELVEMIGHFWRGGTDFVAPLDLAVRLVRDRKESLGGADIVFVTDGESRVSPRWREEFALAKETLGFRVWGIGIGMDRPGGTLADLSDDVRVVSDLTDPAVAQDLFASVG